MNILKKSATVSMMTLLSRLLGLVRDIVIARVFGAGAVLDAFIVAFKIPNFGRRLFAEGSFSQAVMPLLAQSKLDNNENEVISHISGRLLVILFVITLIVVVFSPIFVFLFAPSFYFDKKESFDLAANLLRITFPYLLFVSLTAFFGSVLNNNKKFAIPAFAPVLLNVSLIVGAVYLSEYFTQPIYGLALGVFIGGVLQLVLQLPFLKRIGKLTRPRNATHPVLSEIKRRMLPSLFATGITQVNLLIDTIVATSLAAGSVSWLYYANRLLELPVALIGVALGVVVSANLSALYVGNKIEEFQRSLRTSLHYALIFGIPAAVGLGMLAQPLIITLFQYDNFTISDATNSAQALVMYAFALIFFIITKILTPAFLAVGDTKTPVKVAFMTMMVNIMGNIVLAYYFSFVGIALATAISALVNALGLIFMANKKQIYHFHRNTLIICLKTLIAVGVMALIITFFNFEYETSSISLRIGQLMLTIGSAILSYFLTIFVLKIRIKSV